MSTIFSRISTPFRLTRVAARQLHARYFGDLQKFDGDARKICRQVVDGTWNGTFFQTSLGHYDYFWMRDFGTVAGSLTTIGQRDKVHQTLRWALKHYRKANHVTICIDPSGRAFNAPGRQSIDALPWLVHSLAISKYPLTKTDIAFLNRRIRAYCKKYLQTYSKLT